MNDMDIRWLSLSVEKARDELRERCDAVAMITLNAHRTYEAAAELSLYQLEKAVREMITEGQLFLCTYRRKLALGDQLRDLNLDNLEHNRGIAEDFIGILESEAFNRDIARFNALYEHVGNIEKAIRCATGCFTARPYWVKD